MKSNKTIDFIKELQVGDIIVKDGVFLKESEQSGCYLRNLPVLLKVLKKEIVTDKYAVFNNIKLLIWNSEFENDFTFEEYRKANITIQSVEHIDRLTTLLKPTILTFVHWEESDKFISDWFNWCNLSENTYDLLIRPQQINNSLYY